LASRQYSEEQLRRRLTAKFGILPEIERCINLLKDKAYLSDSRLADSYAAHRTGVKAMGRARLGRELAGKLLSREVIESALNKAFQTVPEAELIDRAIEKRLRSRGVPVSPADRKKMFDYLARLGFEYELILGKMRSLGAARDPHESLEEPGSET
jgi:SOS response regulatory protein OraA/RecX